MKVWAVASEDVGNREICRQAPMDVFTAFLDKHTPHPKIGETAQTGNCWGLVHLDDFSIKREYDYYSIWRSVAMNLKKSVNLLKFVRAGPVEA